MIEKTLLADKLSEFEIKKFFESRFARSGYSYIEFVKTPLGEKIIVYCLKPGIIVGRKGANLKEIQEKMKEDYKLENPIIEIHEIKTAEFDANIMAEQIAAYMEKNGVSRFKVIAHKTIERMMKVGVRGVEILIRGKVPGQRAAKWRFFAGYLPKSGDTADSFVQKAQIYAMTKPGIVGVTVKLLTPDVRLVDVVEIRKPEEIKKIENTLPVKEIKKEEKKPAEKKKPAPKPKKKIAKTESEKK